MREQSDVDRETCILIMFYLSVTTYSRPSLPRTESEMPRTNQKYDKLRPEPCLGETVGNLVSFSQKNKTRLKIQNYSTSPNILRQPKTPISEENAFPCTIRYLQGVPFSPLNWVMCNSVNARFNKKKTSEPSAK